MTKAHLLNIWKKVISPFFNNLKSEQSSINHFYKRRIHQISKINFSNENLIEAASLKQFSTFYVEQKNVVQRNHFSILPLLKTKTFVEVEQKNCYLKREKISILFFSTKGPKS